MQLPILSNISQLVTRWKSLLDPVLANTLLQGSYLTNLTLVATTPKTFNHLLGKTMQGYVVCGQNANAVIWYTQPFNSLTVTLESSADVTFNLWVF